MKEKILVVDDDKSMAGNSPPVGWLLFARKVPTPFSRHSKSLRKTAILFVTEEETARAGLSPRNLTFTSLHKQVCRTGKNHIGKIPMWIVQMWRIPIGIIPRK